MKVKRNTRILSRRIRNWRKLINNQQISTSNSKSISMMNTKSDNRQTLDFQNSSQLELIQRAIVSALDPSTLLTCSHLLNELIQEVARWLLPRVKLGLNKPKKKSLNKFKEFQSLTISKPSMRKHHLLIIIYSTFRKRRIKEIIR